VIINAGHGSKGGSEFLSSAFYTTQIFMGAPDKIFDEKDYDLKRYYFT